jgi:adenosylhomocysteine nucleosidase
MMLKMLIANWLQQQAQGHIEAVRQSIEQAADRTPREPPSPCELAILFASSVEAGGMVDRLQDRVTLHCATHVEHAGEVDSLRIAVIESGMGPMASATAALAAIQAHHPRWLLCAGFASALIPELKRGHVLMANEVTDESGSSVTLDLHLDARSLENNPALHVGRLLTVDHLVRAPEERRELALQHAALACDMESFGAAEACRQAKTRFLAVRVMTETVEDQLPEDVEKLLQQKTSAAKLGAAAGSVWRRPSVAKDLWRFNEDALRASDRMARFLSGLVQNLPV